MFSKRFLPFLDKIVNEIISKIYIIWGRFHERFIENPTYVGFCSILSGSVLGQLVMLLATPIITRLYSPSDFGILSLYTMVVSVLLVFATLKYELAIPLPKENKKAINLMTLCFGLTFGISVISILLIGLIGGVFASETDLSLLSPYLWVISLSIFGGGFIIFLITGQFETKNIRILQKHELTEVFLDLLGRSPLVFLTWLP